MKLEIKTKYILGQEIWLICDKRDDKRDDIRSAIVEQIVILFSAESTPQIWYHLSDGSSYGETQNLFGSFEEAEKEIHDSYINNIQTEIDRLIELKKSFEENIIKSEEKIEHLRQELEKITKK